MALYLSYCRCLKKAAVMYVCSIVTMVRATAPCNKERFRQLLQIPRALVCCSVMSYFSMQGAAQYAALQNYCKIAGVHATWV